MQPIDTEALSEMFFGDPQKVQIVIDALIQRIPEWQDEAKACAAINDQTEIRQLCHRIGGAAGSIKADKLAEAAATLGDIIKANEFDKVPAGFKDLNLCLEELLTTKFRVP